MTDAQAGDFGRQMAAEWQAGMAIQDRVHIDLLAASKQLLDVRQTVQQARQLYAHTYGTQNLQELSLLEGHPGADTIAFLIRTEETVSQIIDQMIPTALAQNTAAGKHAIHYINKLREITGLE